MTVRTVLEHACPSCPKATEWYLQFKRNFAIVQRSGCTCEKVEKCPSMSMPPLKSAKNNSSWLLAASFFHSLTTNTINQAQVALRQTQRWHQHRIPQALAGTQTQRHDTDDMTYRLISHQTGCLSVYVLPILTLRILVLRCFVQKAKAKLQFPLLFLQVFWCSL